MQYLIRPPVLMDTCVIWIYQRGGIENDNCNCRNGTGTG